MKGMLAVVGRGVRMGRGRLSGGIWGSIQICLGILVSSCCLPLWEWWSLGEFVTLEIRQDSMPNICRCGFSEWRAKQTHHGNFLSSFISYSISHPPPTYSLTHFPPYSDLGLLFCFTSCFWQRKTSALLLVEILLYIYSTTCETAMGSRDA